MTDNTPTKTAGANDSSSVNKRIIIYVVLLFACLIGMYILGNFLASTPGAEQIQTDNEI